MGGFLALPGHSRGLQNACRVLPKPRTLGEAEISCGMVRGGVARLRGFLKGSERPEAGCLGELARKVYMAGSRLALALYISLLSIRTLTANLQPENPYVEGDFGIMDKRMQTTVYDLGFRV